MEVTSDMIVVALEERARDGHIVLPHGVAPAAHPVFGQRSVTEAKWNKVAWNPPQGRGIDDRKPDATASTKPSWADVRKWAVERYLDAEAFSDAGIALVDAKRRAANGVARSPVGHDFGDLHVGKGLERMPALVHVLDRAVAAGMPTPLSVMRTVEGGRPVHVWTEASLATMLRQIAERTNHAESAANVLHEKFAVDQAIMRDPDGGLAADQTEDKKLAAREAAFDRHAANTAKYDKLFAAALAKVADADALPRDLATLKAVLTERLEAAATGQQKRIKGALSQQAIDNWAACVEVDQALQEVALECAVGAQRIGNAADAEKAQAAFSAAVEAVKAVSPVNIPEMTHAIAGRRVTISAANPKADPAIRGPVTVLSTSVASTDGSTITGKVTASDGLPVKDSDPRLSHWDFADDYGGKVRIGIEVRNVCGPATYEVDLEVTASGGIKAA